MFLGEKLRQARLEAGLSQRALCGDVITRNMLSQIENGSAAPSMATLQYLAGRLEKPVSFFLEEAPAAASAHPMAEAVALLEQARHLLEAGKPQQAAPLLKQLEDMPLPGWLQRQRILLQWPLAEERAQALAAGLPSLDEELLLRAAAAQDPQRRRELLLAAQDRGTHWQLLMGKALLGDGQYAQAAEHLLLAQDQYPHETATCLEICYRELEDYQKAYFYACRSRNLRGSR